MLWRVGSQRHHSDNHNIGITICWFEYKIITTIMIKHDKVYTVFINRSKLRKSRETRVEICVLMLPVSAFM